MGTTKKWTDDKVKEYKEKILEEISINGLSLRKVCKLDTFPSTPVVLSWLKEDEQFAIQYARACEQRAEKMADEIMDICDATANDVIYIDGQEVVNHNVINRDRLRIDSRKWLMSKMFPKKYGDKIDVTSKDEAIKTVNVSELITQFMDKKD